MFVSQYLQLYFESKDTKSNILQPDMYVFDKCIWNF